MACKDIREKLSAYLEGSVSPEESQLIGEHLNSCQECCTRLEELKKAGELVKNLAEVEPPAWLTPKIMSRVRAEEEKKRGIFQKLFYPLHIKVPIEALATVLIAVTAVYVFRAVEPEMKLAHLPAPTEPMITREEAPKPPQEIAKDSPVPAGKVAPKEQTEREPAKVSVTPPGSALPLPAEEPLTAKKKETGAKSLGARESVALADAVKEPRVQKKLAAAPMVKESAVEKPGSVDVTVRVREVRIAGREVENFLGQLGARKIKRESREEQEILTAELNARKARQFLEKLKDIGEIKEKGMPLDIPEEDIAIRVEIVRIP
jgi:hypothetical protein